MPGYDQGEGWRRGDCSGGEGKKEGVFRTVDLGDTWRPPPSSGSQLTLVHSSKSVPREGRGKG